MWRGLERAAVITYLSLFTHLGYKQVRTVVLQGGNDAHLLLLVFCFISSCFCCFVSGDKWNDHTEWLLWFAKRWTQLFAHRLFFWANGLRAQMQLCINAYKLIMAANRYWQTPASWKCSKSSYKQNPFLERNKFWSVSEAKIFLDHKSLKSAEHAPLPIHSPVISSELCENMN